MEQCSLFGPNGKMFGVSFWASATTQNVATRAFDVNSPQLNLLRSDSMSLKGHRLLVKDVEWCHPAHRKFEGAHPSKGKAKSTGHKAERYWQVRFRSKNMRRCTEELERVDGRSGLRILTYCCPGSSNASIGRQVSTRPPSSTDCAPDSQGWWSFAHVFPVLIIGEVRATLFHYPVRKKNPEC